MPVEQVKRFLGHIWTTPGAVLADQVKSLDWRTRKAMHKDKVSAAEVAEVRAKVRALIG